VISVIIPFHDRFVFVNEAIACVIDQTYRPIELIMVDDHSSEPYSPNVEFTPGFQVKVLRHDENRGPGAARETGRQAATGDYIAYLDSDDLWQPTFLEKTVDRLINNPEIGMCYCKTAQFDGILRESTFLRRRNDQAFNSILPTIFFGRPWSTSACLWARWATERIGPWFNGWTYEDHEYDLRAGVLNTAIDHVPEILCYKREGTPQQLSQTTNHKAIQQKFDSLMKGAEFFLLHKSSISADHQKLIVKKLLRPLMEELISINEYALAKTTARYMIKISPALSSTSILSLLIYVLLNFKQSQSTKNIRNYLSKFLS